MQMAQQLLGDKARRRVLGFADGEGDMVQSCRWLDTLLEGSQLFEGIGLESVQVAVHVNSCMLNLYIGRQGQREARSIGDPWAADQCGRSWLSGRSSNLLCQLAPKIQILMRNAS